MKSKFLIVLPIIDSNAKTIPHTAFEAFINSNSQCKTQNVSQWDVRNNHKSFLY